ETASVTGSLFVELSDIENSELIYTLSQQMLERMDIAVTRDELQAVLFTIHQAVFGQWEKIQTFKDFAGVLDRMIQLLIHKSFMHNYPLNLNIADKILGIKDEFQSASFASEYFNVADIFRIFESAISHEIVAFIGSPLKGLQILGLFETRSLNFKNVIVLDVNEGVLPRLDIYESLIPRDVMISLNLDRLELEEEIQRYQFMRLISAAENVYLVYQKSKDKEKSRFVEELIWEQEKKKGELGAVQAKKGYFHVEVGTKERRVRKTPEMVAMLKQHKYSASSLNMYLRNPMDFYYNYVLGLREKEDLLDEPEARHVGTFIHDVLQHSFLPSVNGRPVIDQSFRQKMFEIMEHRFEETFGRSMKSDAFLLKSVIKERLERFLDNELNSPERRVDEILDLERYCEGTITLSNGPVKFGYIVDRIDRMKDGTIMVIDYKTGSADQMPRPAQEIAGMMLSRENIRDTVRSFQLPLYYHFLSQEFKGQLVNAALYNLRTLKIDRFVHSSAQTSSEDIVQAYQKPLDFIISEILNPDIDFVEDLTV
ncbi:MAG: PD-(D/E)XK nuclease family protein, partial [Candidatus Omnitrophica bacterium]|nr:PD-(D/E)XK nuclease family protein [Candidatus Omnitrophota bacterium]